MELQTARHTSGDIGRTGETTRSETRSDLRGLSYAAGVERLSPHGKDLRGMSYAEGSRRLSARGTGPGTGLGAVSRSAGKIPQTPGPILQGPAGYTYRIGSDGSIHIVAAPIPRHVGAVINPGSPVYTAILCAVGSGAANPATAGTSGVFADLIERAVAYYATWAANQTKPEKGTDGLLVTPTSGDYIPGLLQPLGQPPEVTQGAQPGSAGALPQPGTLLPELGSLSARYESNGNPGTVSSGKGDAGGVSYGAYQMTSAGGGTVAAYVKQSPYKDEFAGLIPGSPEFTKKWKEIADRDPAGFKADQHEFIKKKYYDVQSAKLQKDVSFDVSQRSRALQQVVWSTSVQHGANTTLIETALSGRDPASLSDEQIIKAIYAERGRKDAQGSLVHFKKNSPDVQKGVAARFAQEEKDALAMLKAE